MNKEDLKKLGLTDEAVMDQIIVLHGKDIETHKGKLTTAENSFKTASEQLEAANKQIEDFKKLDVEGVRKAADDYKAKFEQAQKDASTQLQALKFDHAIESGLAGAKVKYSKEVLARLKLDELKDKDGNFIPERFESQIKTVKESASDLFESDTPTPQITTGGKNQPILGDKAVIAARTAMGLPVAEGK
jgi:hypothetical protein